MRGDLYNANCAAQMRSYEVAYPLVDAALARAARQPGPVLELCDLGVSAGANAVAFATRSIGKLRALGEERPVRYGMTDLASNDWE